MKGPHPKVLKYLGGAIETCFKRRLSFFFFKAYDIRGMEEKSKAKIIKETKRKLENQN